MCPENYFCHDEQMYSCGKESVSAAGSVSAANCSCSPLYFEPWAPSEQQPQQAEESFCRILPGIRACMQVDLQVGPEAFYLSERYSAYSSTSPPQLPRCDVLAMSTSPDTVVCILYVNKWESVVQLWRLTGDMGGAELIRTVARFVDSTRPVDVLLVRSPLPDATPQMAGFMLLLLSGEKQRVVFLAFVDDTLPGLDVLITRSDVIYTAESGEQVLSVSSASLSSSMNPVVVMHTASVATGLTDIITFDLSGIYAQLCELQDRFRVVSILPSQLSVSSQSLQQQDEIGSVITSRFLSYKPRELLPTWTPFLESAYNLPLTKVFVPIQKPYAFRVLSTNASVVAVTLTSNTTMAMLFAPNATGEAPTLREYSILDHTLSRSYVQQLRSCTLPLIVDVSSNRTVNYTRADALAFAFGLVAVRSDSPRAPITAISFQRNCSFMLGDAPVSSEDEEERLVFMGRLKSVPVDEFKGTAPGHVRFLRLLEAAFAGDNARLSTQSMALSCKHCIDEQVAPTSACIMCQGPAYSGSDPVSTSGLQDEYAWQCRLNIGQTVSAADLGRANGMFRVAHPTTQPVTTSSTTQPPTSSSTPPLTTSAAPLQPTTPEPPVPTSSPGPSSTPTPTDAATTPAPTVPSTSTPPSPTTTAAEGGEQPDASVKLRYNFKDIEARIEAERLRRYGEQGDEERARWHISPDTLDTNIGVDAFWVLVYGALGLMGMLCICGIFLTPRRKRVRRPLRRTRSGPYRPPV